MFHIGGTILQAIHLLICLIHVLVLSVSQCVCVCVCVCVCNYLSVCLSVCMSPPPCLPACLPVCLCVCLSNNHLYEQAHAWIPLRITSFLNARGSWRGPFPSGSGARCVAFWISPVAQSSSAQTKRGNGCLSVQRRVFWSRSCSTCTTGEPCHWDVQEHSTVNRSRNWHGCEADSEHLPRVGIVQWVTWHCC